MTQNVNENPAGAQSNDNGASDNQQSNQSNQQNTGPQTMSLDDATIERIAAASSRQAAQNVQRNGSQQQQQDAGAQGNGSHSGQSNDLLTAIQALPEQITRSVKEALQPPSNNSGGQQNSGAQSNDNSGAQSNDSQQQTQTPAKKKSFAEWWVGA